MILHIIPNEKFTSKFIDFINANFVTKKNLFLVLGVNSQYEQVKYSNVKYLASKNLFALLYEMNRNQKIIFHSLFNNKLVMLLFLQPWLLKKSYWLLWGGDLYTYSLGRRNVFWYFNEFFRRFVIKNMAVITTTVPGDYNLCKKWYQTNARYIENIMYPSHVSRNLSCEYIHRVSAITNIQIGNSADATNNHKEVLYTIKNIVLNKSEYQFYVPLSYGDLNNYKKDLINYGKSIFAEQFNPIVDFMSFDEYNSYMKKIDIAIFNHNRQQAMGNIIALLSLGKKVIIKEGTTHHQYFKEKGFAIYSLNSPNILEKISEENARKNICLCKKYFSNDILLENWKQVFYE